MPRLDAAKRQDRFDTILDAAEQVLVRVGYAEASVGEVARLAGISDGLIYRYFEGKRDLRDQVLARFYGRLLAEAQAAIAACKTFHERLQALSAFRDDPALCRLFIAEVRVAADYPGSPLQDLNRRYTSLLLRILRQGVLEGAVSAQLDVRLVRDMLYGGMEHVMWRSVSGRGANALGPADVPGTARDIVRLLTLGLAAGAE